MDFPQGIAIDSQDNVYVVDTGNNRIQAWAPSTLLQPEIGETSTSDAATTDDPTATDESV